MALNPAPNLHPSPSPNPEPDQAEEHGLRLCKLCATLHVRTSRQLEPSPSPQPQPQAEPP
jgi:hypothetical protein